MSESLDAMLEDSGLSHLSSKLKSLTISEASQLLSASRPQFLQTLKTLGVLALRERQAVANALGRALRESSAPLQLPTEQLHHRAAAPSTAVPANDGAAAAPLAAKLAADVDKAAGAAEGTVMHAHVINLASRPDRLARFSKRWPSQGLASLSVAQAVDGKALLSSRAAPPPPAGCDDALTAALRDDWRSAVCANDAEWGASQPRKLAAVVGCHCSHLNIWESILARERTWGEDTPVFVFEDDATLAVADVGAWFQDVMLPQLPPDWAFCYLNEPLHLEIDRERSHRPRHAQATADAESGSHLDAAIHGGVASGEGTQPWRAVCASDDQHDYTSCIRRIYKSDDAEKAFTMPPTTEAYVLRPSAARRLVEYSLSYGWCAVDYILAHTFATNGGAPPSPSPYPCSAHPIERN